MRWTNIPVMAIAILLCGCVAYDHKTPSNCQVFIVEDTPSKLVLFIQSKSGISDIIITETSDITNILRSYQLDNIQSVCLDISKDRRESYYDFWVRSGLSVFIFDKDGATIVMVPKLKESNNGLYREILSLK